MLPVPRQQRSLQGSIREVQSTSHGYSQKGFTIPRSAVYKHANGASGHLWHPVRGEGAVCQRCSLFRIVSFFLFAYRTYTGVRKKRKQLVYRHRNSYTAYVRERGVRQYLGAFRSKTAALAAIRQYQSRRGPRMQISSTRKREYAPKGPCRNHRM